MRNPNSLDDEAQTAEDAEERAAQEAESRAEAEAAGEFDPKDLERHAIRSGGEKDFLTGGHAVFTLQNEETGTRFTYKVSLAKRANERGEQPFFAGVLSGPSNEDDYTYLGRIYDDADGLRYVHDRRVSEEAPSARGIAWLVRVLAAGKELPSPMKVYHEGRCARCGRALTVPSSIESGLGPKCAARE